MTSTASDLELIRICLAGKTEAFGQILDRYQNRVFAFVFRMVPETFAAEDLCQSAFLKAFRNLGSYDPSRPFHSWLLKIAHNTVIDFARSKNSQALISLDDPERPVEVPAQENPPDMALEAASRRETGEALALALPALYREIVLLRHQEGLSLNEISEVLGLPEGTVKIRLFRAREMLREKAREMGLEPE
jgi:RNA polymerase sigma-70 factor (ECF subfamily)